MTKVSFLKLFIALGIFLPTLSQVSASCIIDGINGSNVLAKFARTYNPKAQLKITFKTNAQGYNVFDKRAELSSVNAFICQDSQEGLKANVTFTFAGNQFQAFGFGVRSFKWNQCS